MKSTVKVSEGQAKFPSVVRDAEGGRVVTVTRHDTPVAYVIGRERMDAIMETMELLANPAAMKAITEYCDGQIGFGKISDLQLSAQFARQRRCSRFSGRSRLNA